MSSPFPGMNPYLEQKDAWEDFHPSFIVHARDVLRGLVGPKYVVKVETRLYLHELSAEERRFVGKSDVGTILGGSPTPHPATGGALAAAPIQLLLPAVEIERQHSLEIRDAANRRVVTVIELLSPCNKSGSDRHDYLAKRNGILASETHLVEIDLRRGGLRPTPPALPSCDYYVLVSRCDERPHVGMWPVMLREKLPTIPIPLVAPDPPLRLDLQALLQRVYGAGDFSKYIYSGVPEPALPEADAIWARQLVATR